MDLRVAIANQTDFSLHLASRVGRSQAASGNFAFSPLSLHVVLSLVAAGSKGKTLEQISSFLRSGGGGGGWGAMEELNSLASQVIALVLADGSPAGGPRLSFANGVWVEQTLPLKPSFQEIVASTFKGESRSVDFQNKAVEVAGEVNSWAESSTGGLIKELLPAGSVDLTTRLILADALYFKGAWSRKFDASDTKESDFHLLDGSSVRAPFMTSEKKQFVESYDGFQALRLPYKQGDDRRQFSMYLLLPDQRDGLWNLTEKLAAGSGILDRHLPLRESAVGEFMVPKFKISFGFEASGVLKELGLSLPFSSGGDLTEMVEDPAAGENLFVSGIFHKSFVEVNEEGTEAAAASAAVVQQRSVPVTVDFVADHPFVFLIREDMTGVVLFVGHVLNPLLSG